MTLKYDAYGVPYHKCSMCGIRTVKWERINGGSYHCWDCGRKLRQPELDKIEKEKQIKH